MIGKNVTIILNYDQLFNEILVIYVLFKIIMVIMIVNTDTPN